MSLSAHREIAVRLEMEMVRLIGHLWQSWHEPPAQRPRPHLTTPDADPVRGWL